VHMEQVSFSIIGQIKVLNHESAVKTNTLNG
jgi:hypothetical protein